MANRKKQEIGNHYTRLLVIEYAGSNERKNALWKCKCDCGNEVIVLGYNLRKGKIKSCGCFRKEVLSQYNKLPKGEAAFNEVLSQMQHGAKTRNLQWQLTKEEAKKLMDNPCYYCGMPPSNTGRKGRFNGNYKHNGIDRIDNKKGYIQNNIVSCCRFCNRAKGVMGYKDFLNWIKRFKMQNSEIGCWTPKPKTSA